MESQGVVSEVKPKRSSGHRVNLSRVLCARKDLPFSRGLWCWGKALTLGIRELLKVLNRVNLQFSLVENP